jgi:membrane-bound lytic murein transglycosylase A
MKKLFVSLVCLTTLIGCSSVVPEIHPSEDKPVLEVSSFTNLPSWLKDNHLDALSAFDKSCSRFLKQSPDRSAGFGAKIQDWQIICQNRPIVRTQESARDFFEAWFTPYAVYNNKEQSGLFTGYYEASLNGSLTRTKNYNIPLRARPQDLVMVNLGDFNPELKGKRIAGRAVNGYLKPYETRAEIVGGKLPKDIDIPVIWVDSAIDAFFLQIQGSGVVTLPDGSTQRIGYDGQNGHPYTAIGKTLIDKGELTKENVSMQSIRQWLQDNPERAPEVLNSNASYIFFKKLDTEGPIGGEGVVLTPERSLAIDTKFWPYGIPIFVDIPHPKESNQNIQNLMIAQDTGGAIKGVLRGDFFWGYGEEAALNSGPMKSKGQMWVLLPKSVAIN